MEESESVSVPNYLRIIIVPNYTLHYLNNNKNTVFLFILLEIIKKFALQFPTYQI